MALKSSYGIGDETNYYTANSPDIKNTNNVGGLSGSQMALAGSSIFSSFGI